jgi:hypothetical protein
MHFETWTLIKHPHLFITSYLIVLDIFRHKGKDRNAHLLKHLSVHAPNTKFQEGRELRMQIATSQLF